MWPWSRNAQEPTGSRLLELEAQVRDLSAQLRKVHSEVAEVSERAYRFMKRAESRARRALDAVEPNQDQASPRETASTGTPVNVRAASRRAQAWGARGRRSMRSSYPAPVIDESDAESEGSESNGVPA